MTDSPRLWTNPTTDLEAEADEIVAKAKEEHHPSRTFLLVSGGNDSLVLLDAMAKHADEVVHINTGIGIEDTTTFARQVGQSFGLPYSEWTPPVCYEDLVFGRWDGLPGPGAHRFTYQRLKERCVRALLRAQAPKRGERFLLLTGVRKAETGAAWGMPTPSIATAERCGSTRCCIGETMRCGTTVSVGSYPSTPFRPICT